MLNMAFTPSRPLALIVSNIQSRPSRGFKQNKKWDAVCKNQTIQDWHIIQLYKKNVDSRIFDYFMEEISKLSTESDKKMV